MKKNLLHTILKYFNDKLSNTDRHAFEKEVNTDPFLQDAMDGLEQLSAEELEQDLHLLNKRLQKRTAPPRKLFQFYRVAAVITILIGIGSITTYVVTTTVFDSKLAVETQSTKPKQAPITTSKDKIEDVLPEKPTVVEMQNKVQPEVPEAKTENIQENAPPKIKQLETIEKTIPKPEVKTSESVAQNDKQEPNNNAVIVLPGNVAKDEDSESTNELAGLTPGIAITKAKRKSQTSQPTIAYSKLNNSKAEIKGTIYDENGNPLPGASVFIKGTAEGVITDLDGDFTLKTDSASILQIAFIGYLTEEIDISNQGQDIEINMQQDLLALDEVVVVGYGTQKKTQLTGSVTRIEGHELTGVPSNTEVPAIYRAWAIKIEYDQKYDRQAEPVIGWKAYKKYLKKNFELTYGESTNVVAEFEITSDGSINELTITESPNTQFSDKAQQLITNGSDWNPASQSNNAVKQKVVITIKF